MRYDFAKFIAETKRIEEWLKKEYESLNAGRASPALLDLISIDSYGARTAISHVASITVEDARTLRISPWDKNQIKDVERAILTSNLGVTPAVDDQGIRLNFPSLTEERRTQIVKILKERLEDARISIRTEREKIVRDIDERYRAGEMPEDEKHRGKEDLQKIVDGANEDLENLFKKKETEVMGR